MNIAKIAFDFDDAFKDVMTNRVKTLNKIESEKDIVYDTSDPETCVLDVYYPPRDGKKLPVLFDVHGGGWITGDKYWRRGLNKAFADLGLFVVCPNYGLSPKFKYPACVTHLYKALEWVRENAEKYDLDLDNIFITGDSAGGQLACLMLAAQNNPVLQARLKLEKQPLNFKGGLLVCGAYDPEGMAKNPLSNKMWVEMTGYGRKHLREFPDFDLLRPSDFITKNFPKNVFITYARFDAFVGGNEKLVLNKLEELGIPHLVYRAKGAGEHCFHLWHYRRPTSALFFEYARQYIEQELAGKEDIKLVKPSRKEMKARRKGAKYYK